MFYLIDEKDGLRTEEGKILVNTSVLQILDSGMDYKGNKIDVRFYFAKNNVKSFGFNKDNCFNVNQVMQNLSQLKIESYSNNLMSFQDFENVKNLQNKQFYLHKFSNILVNLNNICLVYTNKNDYSLMLTLEKNILIKETPEEVFSMINNRILK